MVDVPAFKLMTTEVTWNQYLSCVDARACAYPDIDGSDGDIIGQGYGPVTHVSWNEVQSYINWLEEETGLSWRLPSEAEWEYAARAGSSTDYNWNTNDISSTKANYNNGFETTTVGRYEPNVWGLYDMHGNASEWTQDCWNETYDGAPTDGTAWEQGDCDKRVLRGGHSANWGSALRSSVRTTDSFFTPSGLKIYGFRLIQGE